MATYQSTAHSAASPLVNFGSEYFKPNTYTADGVATTAHLPFIDYGEGMGCDWLTPDFTLYGDGFLEAVIFGIRAATSWAIMVQRSGKEVSPSLWEIVGSPAFQAALNDKMDRGNSHLQKMAAESFLGHLTRLIWVMGQSASTAQLVAYAEEMIDQENQAALRDIADNDKGNFFRKTTKGG